MIKNIPAYAHDYDFIVARNIDGDFWFWGAYATYDEAVRASAQVADSDVFRTSSIQNLT